jgi:hypothetical protein
VADTPNGSVLQNGWSIAGALLTTVTAVVFLVVFLADLFGLHANPYLGIVFFLILPAFFVLGLVLIPVGGWRERRRRRHGRAAARWPHIDLNDPVGRQRALIVVALTAANLVIISLATYRGVEYMDTPQFCGQVCHQAMRPEYTAYQTAPHSRVPCVACHVGPGASGLVEAKLSGVRRVVEVLRGSYDRPIPPLRGELLPARDTCERCHWPEKIHGDVVKRIAEYASDEQNTESVTTLRLKVGGGSERLGVASGIHWHMNVANEVEFVAADPMHETIDYVRLKDRSGAVREYVRAGTSPEQFAGRERRRMDCMDCHNRPSHPIAPTAARAVDQQLALQAMPKTLPFVRREAVKALEAEYDTEDEALAGIARALGDFYKGNHAGLYEKQRQDVDRAIEATQGIYRRNVFPDLRVTFGTYPNNIGHVDSPGCFRCHNDELATDDGRKISQDCESCHIIE